MATRASNTTTAADAETKAGLPKAVIMDRGQQDKERVNGATYLAPDVFDRVARAGGFGSAGEMPTDASLDLSGLKGKHKSDVEAILSESEGK